MPYEFDDAIVAVPETGGIYRTPIIGGWDIGVNANGGYLMARAAHAMRMASGRRDPLTVTAHYLAPALAGDASCATEIVKSGKRISTVVATLCRDDRELMRLIGSFGEVQSTSAAHYVTATPPDLPPIEECVARRNQPTPIPMGIAQRVSLFIHPDDAGFSSATPPGVGRMRGWFSFADDRPIDTLALLLAADAFPPTWFNIFGSQGWVPTLEMTVHVRAVPAPGPLRCSFITRVVQGNCYEEDGEMWDSNGVCVAMSRQLALAPLVAT